MAEQPTPAQVERAARSWEHFLPSTRLHDDLRILVADYRARRPHDPTVIPAGYELVMEDDDAEVAVFRVPVEGEWWLSNIDRRPLSDPSNLASDPQWGRRRFILRKKVPSPAQRLAEALDPWFYDEKVRTDTAEWLLNERPEVLHPDLVKEHRDGK